MQRTGEKEIPFTWDSSFYLPGYEDSKTGTIRPDIIAFVDGVSIFVEVDGSHHRQNRKQIEKDRNRDNLLTSHGIRHLRPTNDEVTKDPAGAIELIKKAAAS